jgi:hypothetical protein
VPVLAVSTLIKNVEGNASDRCSFGCTFELSLRSDEESNLVRCHASGHHLFDPTRDRLAFALFVLQLSNGGRRAIKHRDGVGSVVAVTVNIRDAGAEQSICLHANLVRGPIVDSQGLAAAANVNAERLPRKRLLKDALRKVACEEQRVAPSEARNRICETLRSCASSITANSNGA